MGYEDKRSVQRRTGVFYTPQVLADHLVRRFEKKRISSVFDPASGDGVLLATAYRRFKSVGSRLHMYGCDISPRINHSNAIGKAQLYKGDFMFYRSEIKYDLILMNPPYVRHHLIDQKKKCKYRDSINNVLTLAPTADLWAYFLIKAVTHLKTGACLGAILPWSFLQADYALTVRKWLGERFGSIRVLKLGERYFESAKERVTLVWLEEYMAQSCSIKAGFSHTHSEKAKFIRVPRRLWTAKRMNFSRNEDIFMIYKRLINDYGFERLEKYANISIGVVTGANDYFIIDEQEAIQRGLEKRYLKPILTSARELRGLILNGYCPGTRLLYLDRTPLPQTCRRYIEFGRRKGVHKRSHSLRRQPWYCVRTGKLPDAFFPYRVSRFPYLVLNDARILSTNSIHCLHFKDNVTEREKKWLQVSLMSAPGQFSIEAHSKTYGEGVLKMEPWSVRQTLVFIGKGNIPQNIYNCISNRLESNDRRAAFQIATRLIGNKSRISARTLQLTVDLVDELQEKRIGLSK